MQRWDPGAKVGITVAGGHGCGSGADQLSHPGARKTEKYRSETSMGKNDGNMGMSKWKMLVKNMLPLLILLG